MPREAVEEREEDPDPDLRLSECYSGIRNVFFSNCINEINIF